MKAGLMRTRESESVGGQELDEMKAMREIEKWRE